MPKNKTNFQNVAIQDPKKYFKIKFKRNHGNVCWVRAREDDHVRDAYRQPRLPLQRVQGHDRTANHARGHV